MIKEYEYLHGVVFTRLCGNFGKEISVRPYREGGYSSFVLNGKVGLYIKYSGKRLPTWRFTVAKPHQIEIQDMYTEFGEVFTALVCHLDGVALINHAELKDILDDDHEGTEWISVKRQRGQMYSVCASNGKLKYKISLSSCPDKVLDFLYPPKK